MVLVAYLIGLATIGVMLARRAAQGSEQYFLGGRKLPWWALGSSGMSSNLDAAGTMTILALIFTYGLHGFFIEMRGGVVLPIAIFLAFMGKWHQRSGVVTTAEWMRLRFGSGPAATAARCTAALTYLIITIAMVVFFLSAAGRFLAVFLPFDPVTCTVLMALFGLAYTMVSGIHGVVWTDVFQALLIAAAALFVGIQGALLVSPELIANWPGAAFNQALPRMSDPGLAPYELFGLFLVFWLGKGVLEGLGGSGGSAYMAQRFYAADSDRACQKIAMLWAAMFAFRWPMVLGFVLIAIHLGIGHENPETILPLVLQSEFFPVGMRGIVVAAIFAASMSTFDSTLNAGASYVVRDAIRPLWRRLMEREITERGQVIAAYIASVGIVAIALSLSLTLGASILGIWTTIVIQLFPAFLVPFALRWFWLRFNGWGFTSGIIGGFVAALWTLLGAPAGLLNEVANLALISSVSLIAALIGTWLTAPVPESVAREFYQRIRPMGLWPTAWRTADRSEHRANWIRMGIALLWQITLFMTPMLAMLRMWSAFFAIGLVCVILTALLLRSIVATKNPC